MSLDLTQRPSVKRFSTAFFLGILIQLVGEFASLWFYVQHQDDLDRKQRTLLGTLLYMFLMGKISVCLSAVFN